MVGVAADEASERWGVGSCKQSGFCLKLRSLPSCARVPKVATCVDVAAYHVARDFNNLDTDIRRTYRIYYVNNSKRRCTDGSVPFIIPFVD